MTTQITLDANSSTAYVQNWLVTAREPRLLHVFDHACNLIDSEGRVISLVTPEIGNGPFNVVVPQVGFADCITSASLVRCREQSLTIGNLAINTTPAQLWDSRFSQQFVAVSDCVPVLMSVLRNQAPPASLAGLVVDLPEPESSLERAILNSAADWTDQLISGLLSLNQDLCHAAMIGLAGLGAGLTPAGDDWIMGCALGVQAGPFDPEVVALAQWIAERAADNTTPLSAAWLRASAQGRCGARWHSLFDAIRNKDESLIRATAVKIAQEGHTSGCDALAGFAAVLLAESNQSR